MTKLTLLETPDPNLPTHESYSPFCLKVHRALRANGLAYERRAAGRPDAWRQFNPTGQVPVLLVGDRAIPDSTAILQEIERITGASIAGSTAAERAESWLYEELADTSLNGFLVASRWADERNWPSVRAAYFHEMPALVRAIVPNRLRANVVKSLVARDVWRAGADACWSRFRVLLDQLDRRAPTKGYWVGDALTAADFALFGQLHSLRTELTPWQREQLAERAALNAYLDRVHEATRVGPRDAPSEGPRAKGALLGNIPGDSARV